MNPLCPHGLKERNCVTCNSHEYERLVREMRIGMKEDASAFERLHKELVRGTWDKVVDDLVVTEEEVEEAVASLTETLKELS